MHGALLCRGMVISCPLIPETTEVTKSQVLGLGLVSRVSNCSSSSSTFKNDPYFLSACARLAGGPKAEANARMKCQEQAAAKEKENFDALQKMRKESFRKVFIQ